MTKQYKVMAYIAVVSLLTASVGAEEPVQDMTDKSLTAEEKIRQGIGVGVIIGEPTGLSVKKWISDTTAIDGALAWSFADFNSFQIHADFLWHNFDIIKTVDLPGRFPVYYGVGGRIKMKGSNDGKGKGNKDEDTRVGVRVPVGISYLAHDVPLDFFAEIVPLLDIVPETKLGIGIGIGARYYFR
jgi:hypothetical protein